MRQEMKEQGKRMQYEGDAYHPPSEARGSIIQVTMGCSHNRYAFYHMYTDKQFRVRKREKTLADLDECQDTYGLYVQRVFFMDGDTLIVRTELPLGLLHHMKKDFPYAERIIFHGTAENVLRRSEEELVALREVGLMVTYLGAESGDDGVLMHTQEGETVKEIIAAGQKLKHCGIQTSMISISGLGGGADIETHAVKSAELINAINPGYTSILTLHLSPESPMAKEVRRGEMEFSKSDQIMDEMELFLTHIDSPGIVFRTNHVSNYLTLAGTSNQDLSHLLHGV